ncbi:Sentrin-specific protease 3 [Labeo rohita]|uniref:Sentrin-specific protease 3 n=1 Tax=Labeo rohita TaxID=84645 RepID=A0ABQ8MDX4_LABRO|nr:Sentrin-specific protease 3 [Labeo rohita]
MTAKIVPATWVLLKNKIGYRKSAKVGISDIPQQIGGVVSGVFMLIYALHLVLGAPFDFTFCDMPKIQRWWTLILLENFGVFSERKFPPAQQAVKWIHLNRLLLRGSVEEPLFLTMNKDDKEKAFNNLCERTLPECPSHLILCSEMTWSYFCENVMTKWA